MKQKIQSLVRRVLRNQDAQIVPITAFFMVGFLGMAAVVIDVGNVYYGYNELVASTNAAALAGAEAISVPSLGSPSTVAASYSSEAGGLNAHAVFNNANGQNTATIAASNTTCNTFVANTLGISCVSYDGPGTANAIQVTQTAKVRTYFAAIFGYPTITLSATASAARSGGNGPPHIVGIIADTTESMTTTDKDSECDDSRIKCTLEGIDILLENLAPCSAGATCSISNGVSTNPVDRVALFTFPNMTTTTAPNDYCDGTGGNPMIEPYTFPSSTGTSMTTMPFTTTTTPKHGSPTTTTYNMTYQVTFGLGTDQNGYLSDYKSSDSIKTLNSASDLTLATGGASGCTGMQAPGGEGTFYAGAIYAAAASIYAEVQANSGTQGVLILISDGDASATQSQMATGTESTTVATNGGSYPSWTDECSQAIAAAQYAKSLGILVYSVAYGTESSGCGTDTSGAYKKITPCETMQDIASTPQSQYFYSDYGDSQKGVTNTCATSGQPTTSLDQIFQDISADFFVSRLVPNNAFSGS